ncbi:MULTISPECIES: hypothetical protein [unclassified Beijerinckia]|uniref:hypothetical protein n=1 Tax=unclassified Beijerinckia TaxID=2638183 RepID=UPI001FCD86BD|nr:MULTISPECIES: hypothetical protein [unclassified Beijerinckia]
MPATGLRTCTEAVFAVVPADFLSTLASADTFPTAGLTADFTITGLATGLVKVFATGLAMSFALLAALSLSFVAAFNLALSTSDFAVLPESPVFTFSFVDERAIALAFIILAVFLVDDILATPAYPAVETG